MFGLFLEKKVLYFKKIPIGFYNIFGSPSNIGSNYPLSTYLSHVVYVSMEFKMVKSETTESLKY